MTPEGTPGLRGNQGSLRDSREPQDLREQISLFQDILDSWDESPLISEYIRLFPVVSTHIREETVIFSHTFLAAPSSSISLVVCWSDGWLVGLLDGLLVGLLVVRGLLKSYF